MDNSNNWPSIGIPNLKVIKGYQHKTKSEFLDIEHFTSHQDYSEDLLNNLTGHGYRAHLDNTNERLGQKIRNSEMKKIPVMIIVGDKEIESDTVSVRTRSIGDLGSLSKDELIEKLISL